MEESIMFTFLGNEKGAVLIIAMVLLGILTFIGLAAIFNTSLELRSSGTYMNTKKTFYTTEGAIEAVKNDGHYATTTTTMAFPDPAHPNIGARDLTIGHVSVTGTLRYVTSGNPPPGYGFSAKDSSANYFVVEATGTNGADVQITQEEMVARILPKSGG
jgi:hypothetical protein